MPASHGSELCESASVDIHRLVTLVPSFGMAHSLPEGTSTGKEVDLSWREVLDVRSGLIGGGLLASIVWFINASHGYVGATTAALKQFAYTFFMGALIMRLCTRLALTQGSKARALWLAIAVPSAVTIGATFVVHSVRGTPEPLLSTLPVAFLSPPAFTVWARRVRRDGCSPWERVGLAEGVEDR